LALALAGCAPRLLSYGEFDRAAVLALVERTVALRGLKPRQVIRFGLLRRESLSAQDALDPEEQ
jgi:hypothetical protein